MRIKVLLVGDDPASLMAEGQLLRERGLLVFTTFNPDNIGDLIDEVKPDVVFFSSHSMKNQVTDAYNRFLTDVFHMQLPVIFTLADDDLYLVTKRRTMLREKRTCVAESIIDGIKMALNDKYVQPKNIYKINPGGFNSPTLPTRA